MYLVLHRVSDPGDRVLAQILWDDSFSVLQPVLRTRHRGSNVQRRVTAHLPGSCPQVLRELV